MTEDPRLERGLFDLPLEAPPPALVEPEEEREPPRPRTPERAGAAARGASRPESLSLFDDEELSSAPISPRTGSTRYDPPVPGADLARASAARPRPRALPPPERESEAATLVARLLGSSGDLVVVAATGAVAALGARWLDAPIGVGQLGPLALFLLAWSFVYFVVPLAFWGATPGMSWAGVVARTSPSEPLSFGQAALRWLGTWLTWATLGLGGLLALTGRSLADRVSGSTTHPQAA
jgi:uncharacterized RDD family membrane protein YckC